MDNNHTDTDSLQNADGVVRFIEWALDTICVVLLVVMTCLTTLDVVGRYFFNAPVPGAYEGNELLLGILIFAALPRVSWHQQHLTVTVLEQWLTPALRKAQYMLISLVSAVGLAILSYFIWRHADELAEYGDMSNALGVPIAPFAYAVAIFTGLAAIAYFCHLFVKKP